MPAGRCQKAPYYSGSFVGIIRALFESDSAAACPTCLRCATTPPGGVIKSLLIRALLRLAAQLPLPMVRCMGRIAARWMLPEQSRAAQVTRANLAVAMPLLEDDQRAALVRESLLADAELIAEMGWVWHRPWTQVCDRLSVEGDNIIRDYQAAGRAIVVMVPHLGNWEVVGLHLATLGPTVSLYQPPKLNGLHATIHRVRQRTGAVLVPTSRKGVAQLLSHLRNGGIVGVLPDQVPGRASAGQNVPFLGVPCFTPTLATRLVARTGAAPVFAYALREPGGFRVVYRCAASSWNVEDETQALVAMNQDIAQCVAVAPAQYQWSYKRFRTLPRTHPDLYDVTRT